MRWAQNFHDESHDVIENKGYFSGAGNKSHDVTENKGSISEGLDNSHDVVDGEGVDSSSHDVAENEQVNFMAPDMARSAARICCACSNGCVIIAASDFSDVAPTGASRE